MSDVIVNPVVPTAGELAGDAKVYVARRNAAVELRKTAEEMAVRASEAEKMAAEVEVELAKKVLRRLAPQEVSDLGYQGRHTKRVERVVRLAGVLFLAKLHYDGDEHWSFTVLDVTEL
jgi:hypothetical protein